MEGKNSHSHNATVAVAAAADVNVRMYECRTISEGINEACKLTETTEETLGRWKIAGNLLTLKSWEKEDKKYIYIHNKRKGRWER